MFILEKLINDHRSKIARWEYDREKWVNAGSYRYYSEYKRNHPHPNDIFKKTFQAIWVIIGFALLALFITGVVDSSIETEKKNRIEENKVVAGKNCKAFNNNDHVKINSGDYSGAIGTIIGGCEKDKPYQVKLDKGVKADIPNDGQDAIDVSGKIVEVSSKKDLILVQLPEDKKE